MEGVLDTLIANAEKLKEVSVQVISKDELGPLQQQQDELIKNLMNLEATFQETFHEAKGEASPEMQKRIADKLVYFQKLNAHFIENLKSGHGIIRFEPTTKEKESISKEPTSKEPATAESKTEKPKKEKPKKSI